MLNPNFSIISGVYQMTSSWQMTLPIDFNQRIKGKSLVIWRPNITIYAKTWGNDNNESIETRLTRQFEEHSEEAIEVVYDEPKSRLQCLLDEDGKRALALSAFEPDGHIEMTIYYNHDSDFEIVSSIAASLQLSSIVKH